MKDKEKKKVLCSREVLPSVWLLSRITASRVAAWSGSQQFGSTRILQCLRNIVGGIQTKIIDLKMTEV